MVLGYLVVSQLTAFDRPLFFHARVAWGDLLLVLAALRIQAEFIRPVSHRVAD